MKAFAIESFGSEGNVRDLPELQPAPGSIVVTVHVAGVNPVDSKIRDGKYGQRSFPLVLGQDFAGTVESVGAGVTRVKAGDRVFGCAREHGAYAEETLVPDHDRGSPFTRIPDGLSDQIAAALPTPALTALASLELLDVRKGTTLLVIGAAGAVGSAAVQIARERGAQVSAAVRPGKEALVRRLGANQVVGTDGDVASAFENEDVRSFDALLDVVSDGEKLKANSKLVRPGGRLVTTVHVADVPWFAAREITATNITMSETPQSSPQGLDELARLALDGKLVLDIAGELKLSDAGSALDELKAGNVNGKLLLRIAE